MDIRIRLFVVSALCAAAPAWAADNSKSSADNSKEPEVVVTATPLRESPFETAQPTTVVGGDDLVRLRALSLGETLSSQLGISATYFGPQASRPVIRGLGGERVQMYEDGGEALDVSALSADHSVTIDPLLAQRVEVVRGPATLLYGNGASGGLINVLTNRIPESLPEEPVGGAVEIRGDTGVEERAIAGRLDGGFGQWAWHADAHKRETDDVRIPGSALSRRLIEQREAAGEEVDLMRDRLLNTDGESDGGALGGSYIGDSGFAGVSVSQFDTNYGIPDSGGETGVRIDMKQTRYDVKGELRDLGSFITAARLRASFNDYEHAEVEDTGEIGTQFDQKGSDTRVSFDHAPFAGWRGNFGVQYRDIDLNVVGEEALVPPSQTRNIGYFVFEERAFGPFTLDFGGRVEQQKVETDAATGLPDYDKSSFSASTGGVWKLNPEYAIALNLTSTQRHPTATELFANGPHIAAQRFEIGDANLRRERATTFDLGLRKMAGDWRGSVAVFRSDYSRYIFAALTGDVTDDEEEALPIVQYQQADAEFTGFESELQLPLWDVPMGTISTRLMADYVRAKLKDGGDLPQIPPLRVGGEVNFDHEQFSTGLSVMYYDTQDKTGPNELPTEGYTLVNADLTYRMPVSNRTMLIFLRGENLLDEEARRHTSPLKDVAPLPGRAAALGVRLEF